MVKFSGLYLFLLAFNFLAFFHVSETDRSFTINYEKNSFYMDGKPFRYVSGSAHYFRMPNQYWRDRLRKIRGAGLNAVSTYVEWSQHEAVIGQYNFTGDLDVKKFIEIAQEEDLYVILRPGPYICAERDMGGLPFWLMTRHPDIQLRTQDSKYTTYVEKWINVLMEELSPLLYGRGGPIIMVQVENEYGSYHSCDYNHTIWLRDLFKKHVKNDAVLFTTDGASKKLLKCGKIPDVYATVDFGPSYNVTKAFEQQRAYEPKGPLVNSEYYPGWLTHWGEKMAREETEAVVKTLKKMLDMGANVNFYMFYGGTNFGFTAGANDGEKYVSDITSYDYDAPITEAGDITDKYIAIKQVVTQYLPSPNITSHSSEKDFSETIKSTKRPLNILRSAVPNLFWSSEPNMLAITGADSREFICIAGAGVSEWSPDGDYGEINLKKVATLFSPKIREKMGILHHEKTPKSFESLDQNFGYLLYETTIPENAFGVSDGKLKINKVSDLAHVYMNGIFVGNMSRELSEDTVQIKNINKGGSLSILVENLGRINFGSHIKDAKGILSNITIQGKVLNSWNMTSFKMDDLSAVEECADEFENNTITECDDDSGFVFYLKKFQLPRKINDSLELDSFLDVSHLTKGLIYINGFNLGRYWSWRGPQYTIYVPGVYLNSYPKLNTLIVMDENINKESIKIKFRKTPIFT